MTVRFMKGTSIAALEREMQQVPGFRPRKSGVIRSRQAGETAGVGSCRYVNVWRAEKEQGMDGHLYTAVDEEMPPAFYQILLRLLAEELPGSALTVRVGKLREEGETRVMFFKSEEHRRRFRALMRCGLYPELFHDGLLRLIIYAVLISRHGVGTVLNEEEVEC